MIVATPRHTTASHVGNEQPIKLANLAQFNHNLLQHVAFSYHPCDRLRSKVSYAIRRVTHAMDY